MIAEILSIYLAAPGRHLFKHQLFRFRDILSVRSHSLESAAQRFTLSSGVTFQAPYFRLSSPPQFSIDTSGIPSQKLISLITSTVLPVSKFQFFEHGRSIMLADDPLRYRESRPSALRADRHRP
jgi:hypothetical protein